MTLLVWQHMNYILMDATTAAAVNSLTPSLTALQIAVRSAHEEGLKAAFSTLQPLKMRPHLERKAAPTLKLLYGT
ncbi:hypothetical protein FF38_04621 [Lucilia cuprina]|uniref:Uncharacterized protein n=1 Tax=Lucilia cuprina TaxID=7375 RepID=A0A0L0BWE2_LUCCU|nr:hypothetical protein FF38_04621 [Lucilia cuprina]